MQTTLSRDSAAAAKWATLCKLSFLWAHTFFKRSTFPLLLKVPHRVPKIAHLRRSRLAVHDMGPHLAAPSLAPQIDYKAEGRLEG